MPGGGTSSLLYDHEPSGPCEIEVVQLDRVTIASVRKAPIIIEGILILMYLLLLIVLYVLMFNILAAL